LNEMDPSTRADGPGRSQQVLHGSGVTKPAPAAPRKTSPLREGGGPLEVVANDEICDAAGPSTSDGTPVLTVQHSSSEPPTLTTEVGHARESSANADSSRED